MTGPEHYSEAEKLLCDADRMVSNEDVVSIHAAAQVHATLALAAATALVSETPRGVSSSTEYHAWNRVAGINSPK